MANHNKLVLVVILGATSWCLAVVWIVCNREVRDTLVQRDNTFSLIAISFFAVSICAFYFVAKRLPRFAMGLAFLAIYFVVLSVYTIASLVLKIDNIWVDGLHYLTLVLLPVSTLILAWQGAKKTKDDKGREGKKEGG